VALLVLRIIEKGLGLEGAELIEFARSGGQRRRGVRILLASGFLVLFQLFLFAFCAKAYHTYRTQPHATTRNHLISTISISLLLPDAVGNRQGGNTYRVVRFW
jgi:hypothetical protein